MPPAHEILMRAVVQSSFPISMHLGTRQTDRAVTITGNISNGSRDSVTCTESNASGATRLCMKLFTLKFTASVSGPSPS